MSYILKKKMKKGFTIVELVIVIAVIAVLAGVLIPTFSSVVDKANESAALQEVQNAYIEALAEALGTDLEGKTFPGGDFNFTFSDSSGQNATIETPSGFNYAAEVKDGKVVLKSANGTPEHEHVGCSECGKCTAADCDGEKCTGHPDPKPEDTSDSDEAIVEELNSLLSGEEFADFTELVLFIIDAENPKFNVEEGIKPKSSEKYNFYYDPSENSILLINDTDYDSDWSYPVVYPENHENVSMWDIDGLWNLSEAADFLPKNGLENALLYGETRTLEENVSLGAIRQQVSSGFTLNMDNKTLTIGEQYLYLSNATINDGSVDGVKIVPWYSDKEELVSWIDVSGDVELNNVNLNEIQITVNGSATLNNCSSLIDTQIFVAGSLAVSNCNFAERNYFNGDTYFEFRKPGASLTISNCTFAVYGSDGTYNTKNAFELTDDELRFLFSNDNSEAGVWGDVPYDEKASINTITRDESTQTITITAQYVSNGT